MSPEINREIVQAVSPEGLVELKREMMPPEVLRTFNRLIGEKAVNGYAIVRQNEVIESLEAQGLERAEIFRRGWLNIESLYEEMGWKVHYDRPAYNETGYAYFTFTAKKN